MAKVFRLYEGGADTYTGWNGSPAFPYNETARKSIKDPNGASAKHEITSIPSPFARIDLVKTAFREVCRMAHHDLSTLDGDTIYHKMVSDSLDVGEIFYRYDNLSDKIEIITCDIRQIMNSLMSDGSSEHTIVADALNKYFKSDAASYNFNQLQNIYLLNYKNGPDELNIIGATSPATLFFCGANDLSYVKDVYFANDDLPFDDEYQPLYKRDKDYIKALWTLRKTFKDSDGNPIFASLFPEVDDYLTLTYRALSDLALKNELQNLDSTYASNLDKINIIVGQQSNMVEVLGTPIYKRKRVAPTGHSGFTIAPTRTGITPLPLVLPIESGNQYAAIHYVNGPWGTTYSAPYADEQPVNQRRLPCDGSPFPYLTISDFLEDYLVKVPHALDNDHYFDGNIEGLERKTSYLLPIKPLYFKYFTVDDLTSTMIDGRHAFEMETLAGGSVRVTLRVPIQGAGDVRCIEYQRIYYKDRSAEVSPTSNSGGLRALNFTGMVMPCMKFASDAEAIYTVACVTAFSAKTSFEFYKDGEKINGIPVDCRNTQDGGHQYKAETYTLEQTNFDVIRVSDGIAAQGLIVPKFATHHNLEDYDFAVDLGTSNTHIEYKKRNERNAIPLGHKPSESVCSHFFVPTFMEIEGELHQEDLKTENDLLDADFIPAEVGPDCDFHFPSRTVLSYAKTTDWKQTQRVFGMFNYNLTYNKRARLQYNAKPIVNIKWNDDKDAQATMEAYINNLMLLIRNKVVALNGNLQETNITWFFPDSMSLNRLGKLKRAWNAAYKKYFRETGSTAQISESVAPIKYYFNLLTAATDLVNVDIGGGTTDIAFSSDGEVTYTTSFRFAANSLFENPFAPLNEKNGIIDTFKDSIYSLLKNAEANEESSSGKLRELLAIYHNNDGQPANMASFFFSLKDNSATSGIDSRQLDFNRILQDDRRFKIVFILFYTAIIYHIAQIVKAKGLNAPRHIAFSGNGSKILSVITVDPDILSAYTKIVFEKILGTKLNQKLEILGLEENSSPKEATCKGGLHVGGVADDAPEKIVLRDASGAMLDSEETYADIDEARKKQIIDSVEEFFRFALEEMPKAVKLDDYFGVERHSVELAREECKCDLETFLKHGIVNSQKDAGGPENPIEDSLSFYPIKGVLNALEDRIRAYYN